MKKAAKKPVKKAKPAKKAKPDPQLANWSAQVEVRLNELYQARADLEEEINRIDEQAAKDRLTIDRLDTEVKRAHARISTVGIKLGQTAGARVTHINFGAGRIFAISRGVALVEWDNGRSTGIDLSQLSDEVPDPRELLAS